MHSGKVILADRMQSDEDRFRGAFSHLRRRSPWRNSMADEEPVPEPTHSEEFIPGREAFGHGGTVECADRCAVGMHVTCRDVNPAVIAQAMPRVPLGGMRRSDNGQPCRDDGREQKGEQSKGRQSFHPEEPTTFPGIPKSSIRFPLWWAIPAREGPTFWVSVRLMFDPMPVRMDLRLVRKAGRAWAGRRDLRLKHRQAKGGGGGDAEKRDRKTWHRRPRHAASRVAG